MKYQKTVYLKVSNQHHRLLEKKTTPKWYLFQIYQIRSQIVYLTTRISVSIFNVIKIVLIVN